MVLILMSLSFVGCSSGKSDDLYTKGLEVTNIMEEMVDSENYANIIGVPNMGDEKKAQVAQVDLSDPVAVYELSLPNIDELIVKLGFEDYPDWIKLTPSLKEQIENKMGFATFANMINSAQGSETIAFCSIYTAIIKDKSIACEKPVTYLYVFDIGTAVAVTFSDGAAQGNFLFADDFYSTEALDELFKLFGVGYKIIK